MGDRVLKDLNNINLLILPLTGVITMKSVQSSLHGLLECPKCGKHSIVEASPNRYHCLNCDFQRHILDDADLPNSSTSEASSGLVATCIVILLILLLI